MCKCEKQKKKKVWPPSELKMVRPYFIRGCKVPKNRSVSSYMYVSHPVFLECLLLVSEQNLLLTRSLPVSELRKHFEIVWMFVAFFCATFSVGEDSVGKVCVKGLLLAFVYFSWSCGVFRSHKLRTNWLSLCMLRTQSDYQHWMEYTCKWTHRRFVSSYSATDNT